MIDCLESLQLLGNPWRGSPSERNNWLLNSSVTYGQQDQDVEFVYWPGCTGAYDPTGQEISRAMVDIFNAAGVSYTIISGEKCCGDPARRLGEEGLFRKLALENIATLNKYRFAKIITSCPHCYNTIKNEYTELGADFRVLHHTEVLTDLLARGQIEFEEFEQRVTFHDPCYLGRYNGIYEQPRKVLRSVPKLDMVEMGRNRNKSLCCGGGGGHIWLEWLWGDRINYMRFADVEATRAQILITACPFCKIMLVDACNYRGLTNEIKVMDLVELTQFCVARK
jgi:Fe-S oxidoreductase